MKETLHPFRIRQVLLTAAGSLLLILTWLWPIALNPSGGYLTWREARDPLASAAVLDHVLDWFSQPQGALFDAPFFWPARHTLAMKENKIIEAFCGAPVRWITPEPIAVLNVSILAGAFVSAWAMALLALRFYGRLPEALLAALIYGCSTWRIAQVSHVHTIHLEWLPLTLLVLEQLRAKPTLGNLAWASLVFAAPPWCGWYQTLALLPALGVWYALRRISSGWVLLLPMVPFFLSLALAARPYLALRAEQPDVVRGEADVAQGLDLLHPFVPPPFSLWYGWLGIAPGRWIEYLVFFGSVPLALLVVALRSGGWPPWAAGMAAVGWLLSLGRTLVIAGNDTGLPLPYAALHAWVPGYNALRVPSRHWSLVLCGAALIVPAALPRLASGVPHRWRTALPWAVVFACALELCPVRLEWHATPRLRAVHTWLAEQRRPGMNLLVLPAPATEAEEDAALAATMYQQRHHGIPLVDGCASYVPAAHAALRQAVQVFPEQAAVTALRDFGVRLVHIERNRWGARPLPAGAVYADSDDVVCDVAQRTAPERMP